MPSQYPKLGSEQVCLISKNPESSYGATISYSTQNYQIMGLTEGRELGSRTSQTFLYGIGTRYPQGTVMGMVENSVSVDIVNVTHFGSGKTILNAALPLQSGSLPSYNIIAGATDGQDVGAWHFVGCKLDSLRLTVDDGEGSCLKVSTDWVAKSVVARNVNASGFQQDASGGPIFQLFGSTVQIGSNTYNVSSISVEVRNNLERKLTASSGVISRVPTYVMEGNFEVTCSLGLYQPPVVNMEVVCPDTNIDATITLKDACSNDRLVITLDDGCITNFTQPLSPNEAISYTLELAFKNINFNYIPYGS